MKVPTQDEIEQQGHGIHRNPGRKNRHDGETDGIQSACLLVKAQLEIFGDGPRLRSVIKRHHKNGHENHRWNRAYPVKMAGHDSILGPGCGHSDYLLGAEIGGEKREPGDPGWNQATGQKKIRARAHVPLEHEPDAKNEHEIDDEDGHIDQIESNRLHPAAICGDYRDGCKGNVLT